MYVWWQSVTLFQNYFWWKDETVVNLLISTLPAFSKECRCCKVRKPFFYNTHSPTTSVHLCCWYLHNTFLLIFKPKFIFHQVILYVVQANSSIAQIQTPYHTTLVHQLNIYTDNNKCWQAVIKYRLLLYYCLLQIFSIKLKHSSN